MTNYQQMTTAQEAKQILTQLIKDAEGPSDIGIKKLSSYQLRNIEYEESRQLTPNRKLKLHESEFQTKFENLKQEEMDSLKLGGKNEIASILEDFNFETGLDLGDKMVNVSGLERLQIKEDGTVEANDVEYVYEDGQVTLVDFWATWYGPCQMPMQHNEDMLKNNSEKWTGKVKVVAISVDQAQDELVQRIKDKGWNRIDHYRMKNGWDNLNQALQYFQIDRIPFVALLDKKGKIVFKGHPSECKIEDEINRLILESGDVEQQQCQDLLKIKKDSFKLAKNFLKASWREFLTQNQIKEFDEYFNFSLQKSYRINSKGQKVQQSYEKLVIEYKVKIEQKEKALYRGNNMISFLEKG